MMMKKFLLGAGLMTMAFSIHAQQTADAQKEIEGKVYRVHTVEKGQTLSGLSRMYDMELSEIQKANGMTDANIRIGQELLIPVPEPPLMKHIVEKGETLFALARKYDMEVTEIKDLNNMESDILDIGQELEVIDRTAMAHSVPASVDVARGPASDEAIQMNRPQDDEKSPVSEGRTPEKAAKETVASQEEVSAEEVTDVEIYEEPEMKRSAKDGFHLVGEGETLFAIARLYNCEVSTLKKLNKLDSENIRPGMELQLPEENGGVSEATDKPKLEIEEGSSLIQMMANLSGSNEKRTTGEEFPELEILKVDPGTNIAPEAKQTRFTEKYSGKEFFKVEESGSAGKIDDLSTDQTKFYGFHKHLPVGSYIRVFYPEKEQSILVEIVNQLPEEDPNIIRLSAKCRDYLMMGSQSAEVKLRYVVPVQ